MNVESVVVKMLADASSYNRVMDGVEARLRSFARSAESIGQFISAPFALATQAVMAFTQALVSAGQAAVEAAIDYEDLAIQLEVLAGSADRGQRLMKEMMDIAVDTPFKVKDVISAGKELAAFGVEVDDLGVSIKRLGDISAGTGTPMHRLILAYGQTQIAGRLMGQEMRQFVNANVPLYEYLGRVMDVPVSRIKKMIENGQVGAEQVTKALNLMTSEGELFGNMMDRLSKTTKGRWNAMIETMEINLAKMGRAFLDGIDAKGIFDELRQDFNSFGTDLETFNELGRNTRSVIRAMGDAVLYAKKVMDDATASVKKWNEENAALVKAIREGIIVGFQIATTVGMGLAMTLNKILSSVVKWANENPGLVKSIAGLVIAILGVTAAVKILILFVTTLIALTGILKVSLIVFTAVSGAVAAVVTGIGLLTGAVGFLASGLGIAALAVAAFFTAWELGDNGVSKLFRGNGEALTKMWNQWKETFSTAWKGIKDALEAGDVELAMQIAFKGIQVAFKQMVAALKVEWNVFAYNVGNVFIDMLQGIEVWLNNVEAKLARNVPGRETILGITDDMIENKRKQNENEILKFYGGIKQPRIDKMNAENEEIWNSVKPYQDELKAAAQKALTKKIEKMVVPEDIKQWSEMFTGKQDLAMGNLRGLLTGMSELGVGGPAGSSALGASSSQVRAITEAFFAAQNAFFTHKGGKVDPTKAIAEAQDAIKKVTDGFDKAAEGANNVADAANKAAKDIERMPHKLGIGPDAKALAEKINQQYMRGVGDETEQLRFFKEQVMLMNEANVGVAHGKDLGGVIGGFSGVNVGGGALSDEAAGYGMVRAYEKLRNWVGNAKTELPRAAYRGTSEAQDIINKNKDRPTTVLEQIQQTLEQAKLMEIQANKYRAETVAALKQLVPLSAAPAPRKVGFSGPDPKE